MVITEPERFERSKDPKDENIALRSAFNWKCFESDARGKKCDQLRAALMEVRAWDALHEALPDKLVQTIARAIDT